jgi:hypothetical protein
MRLLSALLLMTCLTLFMGNGYSQCTPNSIYTTLGVPGVWPNPVQGIASATEGSSYYQDFTVIVPADTTIDTLGQSVTLAINKVTITGIAGYPGSLGSTCSPANCEFPGSSDGCFYLDGTPDASTAGTYDVAVTVVVNVDFPNPIGIPPTIPVDLPAYDIVYTLDVTAAPPVGLSEFNPMTVQVHPNPTQGLLEVKGAVGSIWVYNIQGGLVKTIESPIVDISELERGVYFFRVFDQEGRVYTRKVVKS